MNPRRLLPTMLLMLAWSAPAMADTPLGYLTADGARATRVLPLTWGLLIISIAVCIIITALVAAGTWLRRSQQFDADRDGAGGKRQQWVCRGFISAWGFRRWSCSGR